jgi:hypothetical protein
MLAAARKLLAAGEAGGRWRVWGETGAVCAIALVFAWGLHPQAVFPGEGDFPYLFFAPVLAGLRHGFAAGLGSGVLLAIVGALAWRATGGTLRGLPPAPPLGLVLAGMAAGEFCEHWRRCRGRLEAESSYRRERLETFTRAYHLLKVSHDRLEHRLLGHSQSLRGCLLTLQKLLDFSSPEGTPLKRIADAVLDLFATQGAMQIGALFDVDAAARPLAPALARHGGGEEPDPRDPLVLEALKLRKTVSVYSKARAAAYRGGERRRIRSALVAAVPLIDVHGRIWGVVAVVSMPFQAFHEENLGFLSVLSGHIGDLLRSAAEQAGGADLIEKDFVLHLRRALADARGFRLPAAVASISCPDSLRPTAFFEALLSGRRGLDRALHLRRAPGAQTLLLLLPQTDASGLKGFLDRVETLCLTHFASSASQAGITIISKAIDWRDSLGGVAELLELKGLLDASESRVRRIARQKTRGSVKPLDPVALP